MQILRKNPWKILQNNSTPKYFVTQKVDPSIDYYKILGVSQNSTPKEIKTQFYKMAKQYHPDVYKGSPDKIKEVNSAYEVLGDKSKKQEYDMLRQQQTRSASSPSYRKTYSAYGTNDPFRKRDTGKYDPNEYGSYYWEQKFSNPNQSYYYHADKYYEQQKNQFNNRQQYTQTNFDAAFKDFVNQVYSKRKEAEQQFAQNQRNAQANRNNSYRTEYSNTHRNYNNQQQSYSSYNYNNPNYNTQQNNFKDEYNPQYSSYNRSSNTSSNSNSSYENWNQQNEEAFQFYKRKMEEQQKEQILKQREYDQWRQQKEEQFVKDVEQKVENIKNKAQEFGNKLNTAKQAFSSIFGSKK